MTDSVEEDDRKFEQVLNRLDALMKRSQGDAVEPPEETAGAGTEGAAADDGIPVLTEIFDGGTAIPGAAEHQEMPFVLLEAAEPPPPQSQSQPEVDAESVVAELMPMLREAIEASLREGLVHVQQTLQLRLQEEMEQALRQRLLPGIKPK